MVVLSSKCVTTRKPHKCTACGRIFPSNTSMLRIATADAGTAYTDYMCGTCSTLILKHDRDITEYTEGSLYEAAVEFEEEMSIKARRAQLKKHQIYKHFKGVLYIVEDIAIDANTKKEVVIYRALYGQNLLFTRPIDEFLSTIDMEKYPNASQTYRFEAVNIVNI